MLDSNAIRTDADLLDSLSPGETVEALDRQGKLIAGTVDVIGSDLGVLWIYQDSGARQLLDIREHQILRAAR